MDELVIDDKKYVSSKRAAKLTGYAKDYVGQLCREGRVTARLVGRSWYVLESAIHDHRFSEKPPEAATPSASVFSSTWTEAKYEPSPLEATLPSAKKKEEPVSEASSEPDMASRLQDSWKAWFERVGEPAEDAKIEEEPAAAEEPQEEATSIPIRAIHHAQYQPFPHEILPRRSEISPREEREEEAFIEETPRKKGMSPALLQLTGVLLALIMGGLAVAGSGYFDSYILSNQKLGSLSGAAFYNR